MVVARNHIDKVEYNMPEEWDQMELVASFSKDGVQASVTSNSFTFTLEAAQKLVQYYRDGANGIGPGLLEGLDYGIEYVDNDNTVQAFTGMLDFVQDFTMLNDRTQVRTRISDNDLSRFSIRVQNVTFTLLRSKGVFTAADYVDIPYGVEEVVTILQRLMLAFLIYLTVVQAFQFANKAVEDVSEVGAIAAGGAPLLGQIASVILLALKLALNIAMGIFIAIQLHALLKQFVNQISAPTRYYRGIRPRTALGKAVEYLGYKLVSPIKELDTTVMQPIKRKEGSKTRNSKEIGLPKSGEPLEKVSEMIQYFKNKYNAKTAIIGDEYHLRPDDDPFWDEDSDYVMPSYYLGGEETFNLKDVKAVRSINFTDDPEDKWSYQNVKGKSFETFTLPKNTVNAQNNLISGSDEILIPTDLTERKDSLEDIEKILRDTARVVDKIINVFGGNSDLAGKIQAKVGRQKLSQHSTSIMKVFPFINGNIPVNHRDLLSAKYLEQNFHHTKSMVQGNFKGLKSPYKATVPFSLNQFKALVKKNRFKLDDGRKAYATNAVYKQAGNTATIEFYVHSVWTENLEEETVEL